MAKLKFLVFVLKSTFHVSKLSTFLRRKENERDGEMKGTARKR
jgi:hypothetical protein